MSPSRKDIFKDRFTKYYSTLCHIAYKYIADKDDCEDIVQNVFIAVWDKGKDALPEGEFAYYITRAVKNSCISQLRRQPQDTISAEEAADCLPDDDTEETNYGDDAEDILQTTLAILSPRCKEVFLMAKLQGMKYREIAEELQISEKTVENLMGKAIKQLRAYIEANPHVLLLLIIFILQLSNRQR